MILQNCKILGEIDAKPSKSIFQRLLALAILSNKPTIIQNISLSEDGQASIKLIEKLGNEIIIISENSIKIIPHLPTKDAELNCNESGLCIRMFSPILALFPYNFTINAVNTLLKRKIDGIQEILTSLGASVVTNDHYPPINITGSIKPGDVRITKLDSSQFLSGLLIALPFLEEASTITIGNIVSKPYLDLTLYYVKLFGGKIEFNGNNVFTCYPSEYSGGEFQVENDWTNAATMMIAGAIGGQVQINNISSNSPQGDKVILNLLTEIGAKVIEKDNSILVVKNELNNFEFDANNFPDLVPALSVLAANCRDTSTISNVDRLSNKESNRLKEIIKILTDAGIKVEYNNLTLYITGGKIYSQLIEAKDDHRIAMMAGLLSINNTSDLKLNGADSVNKSYPEFWNDFNSIKK